MTEVEYVRPEGDTTTAVLDPLEGFPGMLDCVHCGLCLNACPTYRATGDENDSPRGRIFLLRAAAEGRVEREEIETAIDRCVLCRACEPVCPSKVPYHRLVERHREGHTAWPVRLLLDRVLPSRRALRATGYFLRGLRTIGLLGLVERFGFGRLRALAGAVPDRPSRFVPESGRRYPAHGSLRGRVGLHLGCINAELFGDALADTVRVLTAQGFEVVVPEQPACCGALHAHSGQAVSGRRHARRTLAAFSEELDAILVPAAGCSAHLYEHNPARNVADPLVFLHEQGARATWRVIPQRVAYDPPCHLHHVQGRKDEVVALLAQLPGLERLPHRDAELCCGAGGIAFARQPEISDAVLAQKIDAIEQAEPEVVLSGNPGCLLRIESGLRRRGSRTRAQHPIQVLARALKR